MHIGGSVGQDQLIYLAALMALAAALYSSVGHGGASAYLAIMALAEVSPAVMRPTALALNLLVSAIATIGYARHGQINWRLFLLVAATAVPMAWLGGTTRLPPEVYKALLGVTLWLAAARLAWQPKLIAERETRLPRAWVLLLTGGALGLLAGLTGTGGGIFLSPLVLLFGWEKPRPTSGTAAAFILVNSAAGLTGQWQTIGRLPEELPWLLVAVAIGGAAGTFLGARKVSRTGLLWLLAAVLAIAGYKLLFT